MKMSMMPQEMRPRERMQKDGANALSTPELIAILLGSGTQKTSILDLANEMVTHFGSIHTLLEATPEELKAVPGIGPAKALQLKAAFGLAQRYTAEKSARAQIRTALSAYNSLKHHFLGAHKEKFAIALRDIKGNLIHTEIIATGILNEVLTHPREIFAPALKQNANSIIIAHNHPSNDTRPSRADLALTQKLATCGLLLGIRLDDHLIVSHTTFTSLYEEGRLEKRVIY